MGDRVLRLAQSLGIPDEGLPLLGTAHDLAMEARHEIVPDDHDPRFLHPGRSALVAMEDGGVRDGRALAAVMTVDSWNPDLAPGRAAVADRLGPEVADLSTALPVIGDREPARVLEELLELDLDTALLALAEQLDHLRHAHLGTAGPIRQRYHRMGCEAYRLAAERTGSEVFVRRYAYWCRTFHQRFLR